MSSKEGEIKAEAEKYKVEVTGERGKKEATIYTHYGTVPVSERRDHKAAQARARACHHFMIEHDACMNRYLMHPNGKQLIEEKCGDYMEKWRKCFAQGSAQERPRGDFRENLKAKLKQKEESAECATDE